MSWCAYERSTAVRALSPVSVRGCCLTFFCGLAGVVSVGSGVDTMAELVTKGGGFLLYQVCE